MQRLPPVNLKRNLLVGFRHSFTASFFPAFALATLALATLVAATDDKQAQTEFFESKIRPVLVNHCYPCHSAKASKQKGGLLLDSASATRRGGESGKAVVPGKPDESLLLSAIHYQDFEMPPAGKLSPQVIRDFEKWIREGAIDPRVETKTTAVKKSIDWDQAREFWSFKPVRNPKLPTVNHTTWGTNRIDSFVLRKLEAQGLEPSALASSRQLNRRISFDLIGLPPDELEPNIEKLVDRLMASPAFGEKWARFWLDLSRYAEDQAHIVGNNQSLFYPNAFRFRDWVIDAFNRDQPYDEFVKDQLAVDLIAKQQGRQINDRDLAALGFLGLGPKYYRRNDLSVMADEWEDRVDTVSRGLLGLTVACARCHDHKYDPVSTEDYYALAGVFASTDMYNKPVSDQSAEKGTGDNQKPAKKKAPKETIHIVRDAKKITDLHVFRRGDASSKGKLVRRRFLTLLDPSQTEFNSKSSGRFELANAIANPENPLFARVIVNRVWDKLVGKPLVETQSNFGKLGGRPTHPELLDDLTRRFIDHQWSIKWLIREIVLSSTYQQSSVAANSAIQRDPENKYYTRMNRKRLSIEQWRDAMLVANQRLLTTIGGKSIDPTNSKEYRRTVYARVSRFQLAPMLGLFDFPDPNAHAAHRNETITPLQKMFALNSRFLIDQAGALADSFDPTDDDQGLESWVTRVYRKLFQRDPTNREVSLAKAFLIDSEGKVKSRQIVYLQTLLISNEFTYID